ncbi:MAG: aspartate--tRNA ligase [Clostridiales bacterium]|nr:aspartate--tRNA ligase [Clostridiales bacterium]
MKKNIYKTNNCGELRLINVGQEVRLAGWVNSIRKLGGITFLTLRDHFGVTQIIVNNEEMLRDVCKESTISVLGEVVERSSKNLNMPTGEIEVVAKQITLLGKSLNVLPFEISEAPNTKEELRLKYRYLDLRNPANHDMVVFRSKVLNWTRNKLTDMGFIEVQTPILTSSSPEGARDYIVPTINAPGEFYALPQAPQQFKQLLMISGFDKYFQVAPCFRNEAARADRSPGEFYQIDLEMSFATQDDVMEACEEFATELFTKFSNKLVDSAPFIRIPYKQAIEKYCSDKPDLRNPLIVHDLSNIFKGTEFNAFKNKTIKAICANAQDKPRRFYDDLGKTIVAYEGKGMAWLKFVDGEFSGSIVKFLTEQNKADLIAEFNLKGGESIFIIADEPKMAIKLANVLRNELGEQLNLIDKNRVAFCWVCDFPFFEENEETGGIDFSHNPFSMPQGGLEALEGKNPFDIVAYQYDLVCNGYETLSGAVRNHQTDLMVKAFEMAGYTKEDVETKFGALYTAFQYGAPPHAGGAFGLERLLMILTDNELIRDVITFPLNKNAKDLLMGAPSAVSEKQLTDVGIQLIKKD